MRDIVWVSSALREAADYFYVYLLVIRLSASERLPMSLNVTSPVAPVSYIPDELNVIRFFGAGDIGSSRLLFGWAKPEENHNWNDGFDVGYMLNLSSPPKQTCRIRVEGRAYTHQDVPCQEMTMYVNGLRLGWWSISDPAPQVLDVIVEPEQWLVRDNMALARIAWYIPTSVRPCDLSVDGDERQLGFCFHSITVLSD